MWEKINKISQSEKHPASLLSHCMFWVIILLEDAFSHVQLVIAKSFDKITPENLRMELCVHEIINTSRVANVLD